MTDIFKAKWADGRDTTIEAGPLSAGTAWLSVDGDPELVLTAREAAKLAHALLTIAASAPGTARQLSTGSRFMASDPGPDSTVWVLAADLLT